MADSPVWVEVVDVDVELVDERERERREVAGDRRVVATALTSPHRLLLVAPLGELESPRS